MAMAAENCLSSSQINKIDNEKLVSETCIQNEISSSCSETFFNLFFLSSFQVRPKVQLQTLLKDAGADKDVFTMKEVGRKGFTGHFVTTEGWIMGGDTWA